MQKPFFSIVMPTYNRAGFLETSIGSVLNQDFVDWELIIIDDFSNDHTSSVVEAFKDERIRYFRNPENIERSASRNRGIGLADGQYICFLDSDDEFRPFHLSNFFRFIDEMDFPKAFLFSDFIHCDKANDVRREVIQPFEAGNIYDHILLNVITSQQVCAHKEIFGLELYDPSIRIGEDKDLWLRIIQHAPFYYVPTCSVIINEHEHRSVNFNNIVNAKDNLYSIRLGIKRFRKEYSSPVRRLALSIAWYNMVMAYLYNGKRTLAFFALWRMIFIKPGWRTREKVYLLLESFIISSWILRLFGLKKTIS